MIRTLQLRQIGQAVRNDGPQSHLSKKGTPTMGGALILTAITISTLLWADLSNLYIWVVLGVTIRSEEHTSELQSRPHLVCRLLLVKKNKHDVFTYLSTTYESV